MKVFVAGATGVIGRPLVRRLLDAGHAVTAMTRVQERADELEALGAEPALCDVFEHEEVAACIGAAEPWSVTCEAPRTKPRSGIWVGRRSARRGGRVSRRCSSRRGARRIHRVGRHRESTAAGR